MRRFFPELQNPGKKKHQSRCCADVSPQWRLSPLTPHTQTLSRRPFVPKTYQPTAQVSPSFWPTPFPRLENKRSPPPTPTTNPSIRQNMRPSTSHQAARSLLCLLPAVLFSWPPVVVFPLPPPPPHPPLPLLRPPTLPPPIPVSC